MGRLPEDFEPSDISGYSMLSVSKTEIHSNLPPIGWMKAMEEMEPGFVKDFLARSKAEHNLRLQLAEREMQLHEKQSSKRLIFKGTGLFMGFSIVFGCLAGAIYLGMHDHEWLAGAIFSTTTLGLVSLFITGGKVLRKKMEEENEEG